MTHRHPHIALKARRTLLCLCLFLLPLAAGVQAVGKPSGGLAEHAGEPWAADGLLPAGPAPESYRGLMLDVSRHYFPTDFILKQIDAMQRLRLNRLHLHLTDAGGWRMEVNRYPLLTRLTAYRTQSDWIRWWNQGDRRYGGPYGGYYTQQELRRIVAYARERGIEVVPEIEMPGHSEEVLAAYPELQCPGSANTGSLCIGNEQTFRFLEDVLEEVMSVFPSTLIHIGGDEANTAAWERCERCRQRMRDLQLTDVRQLQHYLTRRVGRYLADHGRRLAGWDEIVGEGSDPSAVVFAWRGSERVEAALAAGHDVVLTPASHYYLDYYQDAPATQPVAMGDYTPLAKTMLAPDVPARGHIVGRQGNLWTELVATPEHAEYMLYPRLIAIALQAQGYPLSTDGRQPDSLWLARIRQLNADLRQRGYHAFDLTTEVGQRAAFEQPVDHDARGCRVEYRLPYASVYAAAGTSSLTDGLQGSWSYNDGRWQGFIGRGRIDVVVDLGRRRRVRDIGVNFLQNVLPEVYAPAQVVVSVSDDGTHFRPLYDAAAQPTAAETPAAAVPDLSRHYLIDHHQWHGRTRGRYVRLQADASAEHGGWLFIDEVVVNRH